MLAQLLAPLHDMQHAIAALLREPGGAGAFGLFALSIVFGAVHSLLLFALADPALAERLCRGMDEKRRARTDRWLRAIGGAIVVCVGTGLVLSA